MQTSARLEPVATSTRLRGRALTAARAARTAIIALSLFMAAVSVPAAYQVELAMCAGSAAELAQLDLSIEACAGYYVGLRLFTIVNFAIISAILFWRRSDDWMAMLLSVTFVAYSVAASSMLRMLELADPRWHLPVELVHTLGNAGSMLTIYLFPDGRFVPRWTRWLAAAWVAWMFVWPFFPDTALNPRAWPRSLYVPVIAAWFATALFAQVYRYRKIASAVQQQQTKWAVFGFSVVFGSIVLLNRPPAVSQALAAPGVPRLLFEASAHLFGRLCQCAVPASLAVAVLRYRLWDIDLIIRRTLVYSVLTAALALVYFTSVAVLERLMFGAGRGRSELAIVATTLAIAALAAPLRRAVQGLIDRRFYRRRYDAARIQSEFSATMRDETDLDRVRATLVDAVNRTVQPESVDLWLRPTASARR